MSEGYPAPNGHPMPDGYPAPNGYPARGDYPGTDGYEGPAGSGEPLNGGSYAYVIRQGEEFGPGASRDDRQWRPAHRPPQKQGPPRGQGPLQEERSLQVERSPQEYSPRAEAPRPEPLAGSDPSTFVYRDVGGADEPDEPETAQPYGPDDPAYGPPSPDWYARGARDDEEEARQQAAAEDLRYVRGPFEPLPHTGATASQAASYQGITYEQPGDDNDDSGDNDLGAPGDKALEQIKDLYMTAEAIGVENLDRHFQQLLERQRQLISEYFKEADAAGHSAASGLEDLNGTGNGSGRLAFGGDQRSTR
jgi:hypothetical protein